MPESLFNKVAGIMPATLLKKRLWHSCFLVHVVKFLRTPFSQNTSGRLLLDLSFFFFSSITCSSNIIVISNRLQCSRGIRCFEKWLLSILLQRIQSFLKRLGAYPRSVKSITDLTNF